MDRDDRIERAEASERARDKYDLLLEENEKLKKRDKMLKKRIRYLERKLSEKKETP